MRSVSGVVGAATILASYPLALATQALLGSGSETVIHFVTGTGFLVFAASVFDFAVPRWLSIVGAAAAAGFGAILVLQGLADLTGSAALDYVAFEVLGTYVERLLPDVVYIWFVALLFYDSRGKSRLLGGLVMIIVVAAELGALLGALFGFELPGVKAAILLPFVWLLVESVERPQMPVEPHSLSESSVGERRR